MTEDDQRYRDLEPGQLAADRARPLRRAPLSGRRNLLLWTLRISTLAIGAMVIWTFIAQIS